MYGYSSGFAGFGQGAPRYSGAGGFRASTSGSPFVYSSGQQLYSGQQFGGLYSGGLASGLSSGLPQQYRSTGGFRSSQFTGGVAGGYYPRDAVYSSGTPGWSSGAVPNPPVLQGHQQAPRYYAGGLSNGVRGGARAPAFGAPMGNAALAPRAQSQPPVRGGDVPRDYFGRAAAGFDNNPRHPELRNSAKTGENPSDWDHIMH